MSKPAGYEWDDHFELLFPNDFIKWPELKGRDVNLTISGLVDKECFDKGARKKVKKRVLAFKETEKVLGLNRTNAETMVALYGMHTNEWRGKRITIYADPTVKVGGKTKGGIRIRDKVPA